MSDSLGRVHLVGVGGAGMSGIARLLLARGTVVSGSDEKDSPALAELRTLGARVHVGHAPEHVGSADTVVVSSAIRPDNPELLQARAAGLAVRQRAEALAALLVGRRAVAVAGTHGKTTTTAMLAAAVRHCGVDPSYAIGGDPQQGGGNAHHGSGELFLLEADESDGSFLGYSPYAAVVTNVEADHLDHHGTVAAYEQAFDAFVSTVDPAGFVVVCADDPGARRLGERARAAGTDVRSYGSATDADLRLLELATAGATSGYLAELQGRDLGPVRLQVPGVHLARNSAAALLTGLGLGLPAGRLVEGLAAFAGVHRRMELVGTASGVHVYDDYAHHPTEVRAQLVAARGLVDQGRLVAVFQPHLYSRTVTFAAEFGAALALADEVVVMGIYGAREDPVPGVTGALVAGAVPLPAGRVRYEPTWADVPAVVAGRVAAGDLVLTLGAGDVTRIGPAVLRLLDGTGR